MLGTEQGSSWLHTMKEVSDNSYRVAGAVFDHQHNTETKQTTGMKTGTKISKSFEFRGLFTISELLWECWNPPGDGAACQPAAIWAQAQPS
jgi:hypothetical protein